MTGANAPEPARTATDPVDAGPAASCGSRADRPPAVDWNAAGLDRRFHDGTRAAFRAAIRRRTGGRPDIDPDDVLQDAYVSLVASIASGHRPDLDEAMRMFAKIIVRRRAIDALRRVGRLRDREPDAVDAIACSGSGTGEPRAVRFEDRAAVLGLLEELPEAQSAPIRLVYLRGLSYAEAARHLEVNVNTLRTRIYRGLDSLRKRASALGLGSRAGASEADR